MFTFPIWILDGSRSVPIWAFLFISCRAWWMRCRICWVRRNRLQEAYFLPQIFDYKLLGLLFSPLD
jgi:hypothetical protein